MPKAALARPLPTRQTRQKGRLNFLYPLLPLAESALTDDDWQEVERAFAEHRDPLTGHTPSEEYSVLFHKILRIAPAPIGLGEAR